MAAICKGLVPLWKQKNIFYTIQHPIAKSFFKYHGTSILKKFTASIEILSKIIAFASHVSIYTYLIQHFLVRIRFFIVGCLLLIFKNPISKSKLLLKTFSTKRVLLQTNSQQTSDCFPQEENEKRNPICKLLISIGLLRTHHVHNWKSLRKVSYLD